MAEPIPNNVTEIAPRLPRNAPNHRPRATRTNGGIALEWAYLVSSGAITVSDDQRPGASEQPHPDIKTPLTLPKQRGSHRLRNIATGLGALALSTGILLSRLPFSAETKTPSAIPSPTARIERVLTQPIKPIYENPISITPEIMRSPWFMEWFLKNPSSSILVDPRIVTGISIASVAERTTPTRKANNIFSLTRKEMEEEGQVAIVNSKDWFVSQRNGLFLFKRIFSEKGEQLVTIVNNAKSY